MAKKIASWNLKPTPSIYRVPSFPSIGLKLFVVVYGESCCFLLSSTLRTRKLGIKQTNEHEHLASGGVEFTRKVA